MKFGIPFAERLHCVKWVAVWFSFGVAIVCLVCGWNWCTLRRRLLSWKTWIRTTSFDIVTLFFPMIIFMQFKFHSGELLCFLSILSIDWGLNDWISDQRWLPFSSKYQLIQVVNWISTIKIKVHFDGDVFAIVNAFSNSFLSLIFRMLIFRRKKRTDFTFNVLKMKTFSWQFEKLKQSPGNFGCYFLNVNQLSLKSLYFHCCSTNDNRKKPFNGNSTRELSREWDNKRITIISHLNERS